MAVEIFTDFDFSGTTSGLLNQDFPYIGDFWNDKISSIKVYSDTWEFFEHANFQGRSFRLGQGTYPYFTTDWNDVISSIKKVGTLPSPVPSSSSIAQRVLDLTNIERARIGAPPLRLNAQLMSTAQAHSENMARYKILDHTTPGELPFPQRFLQAGYRWSAAAENIARGVQTPEAVMQAWMASPLHRANLLSAGYQDLGVGYANNYWTQDFGKPA